MSNSSKAVKKWREVTKTRMVAAMGGKCQCCGYNSCTSALAFHHLDPTNKDLGLGAIRGNPKSWNSIVVELRKCILVCHNCHSEIHAGIRTLPQTFEAFNEEFVEYKDVDKQDNCPVCNNLKPAAYKFCSQKCSASNRRKVDWDNIDLLKMLKEHTISELETMLNISNAAIYKRRDKLLKLKPC